MSSKLSDRSEEENQRNLERFTPLMYQLKKSGNSESPTHSMRCDVIGQEPGSYPYPSGDGRVSANDTGQSQENDEEDDDTSNVPPQTCFRNQKYL